MKLIVVLISFLIFSSCGEDSDGKKSMVGGEGGNNGSSAGECEVDEDCDINNIPYLTGNNGVRCEPIVPGAANRCSECSDAFPCPEGYVCSRKLICIADDR